MRTETSRSTRRLTCFLLTLVAAYIVVLSTASSALAQGTPATTVITLVDGPVSPAQRSAWEATVTQAGLVAVPGREVDAALQFSPPANGDAVSPESLDALRKSMGAAMGFAVSVKVSGTNYVVRVGLVSDKGPKQKFSSLPVNELQTGVSTIISTLIAEHRGQAAPPAVPTPVPVAVPVTPVTPTPTPTVPAPVTPVTPVAPVAQPAPTVATVGGQTTAPPPPAPVATAAAPTPAPEPATVATVSESATDETPFSKGHIKIGATGVFVVPTGDFADAVSMGLGALVTGSYELAPQIQVSARVGLIYFSADVDDLTMMAMPMWAGARYYLQPNRESIFIHGEAGINDFYSKFGDTTDTQLTYAINATVGKKLGKYMVEGGLYLSDLENTGSVTMFGGSAGTTF